MRVIKYVPLSLHDPCTQKHARETERERERDRHTFCDLIICKYHSQEQSALRHGSVSALMLGVRFRTPLRAWKFIFCICCVPCRQRSSAQADHSFREALPAVCVTMCVIQKPKNWIAWASVVLFRHKKYFQINIQAYIQLSCPFLCSQTL